MEDRTTERRGNYTDLIGGTVLFAICAVFVFVAWGYGIGRPARMGPGFYPFAFGIVGMALAAAIMLRSLTTEAPKGEAVRVRPLLVVGIGVVLFGLLIETAGLGPAVFISTLVTAFADKEARLVPSAILALGMTIGVWFVFVYLLGLPIPLVQGLR